MKQSKKTSYTYRFSINGFCFDISLPGKPDKINAATVAKNLFRQYGRVELNNDDALAAAGISNLALNVNFVILDHTHIISMTKNEPT